MKSLAMIIVSALAVNGQVYDDTFVESRALGMEDVSIHTLNGTSTQGWISGRGIVVYVALFLVSLIFGLCTAYLLKFGYNKFNELKQLQKRLRSNENFITEDRRRVLPKEFPELSIDNNLELTPRRKAKLTKTFKMADETGALMSSSKYYGTGDEELPLLPDVAGKNSWK